MLNKLIRFAGVGAVGFLVDMAALFALGQLLAWVPARAGAFWLAASSNWWLNRRMTFSSDDPAWGQQWRNFLLAACIAFVPNWGCYWWLMGDETLSVVADFSLLSLPFSGVLTNLWPERAIQWVAFWSEFWPGFWLGFYPVFYPYAALVPGIILGMGVNFLLADRWVFAK